MRLIPITEKMMEKMAQQPPDRITEYSKLIELRIQEEEERAHRMGMIDPQAVEEIIRMKLRLDFMYATWLQEGEEGGEAGREEGS